MTANQVLLLMAVLDYINYWREKHNLPLLDVTGGYADYFGEIITKVYGSFDNWSAYRIKMIKTIQILSGPPSLISEVQWGSEMSEVMQAKLRQSLLVREISKRLTLKDAKNLTDWLITNWNK